MLRGAYSHLNYSGKLFLLVTLVFSFLLFSALSGILMLVPFYGPGILDMLSNPDYSDPSVVTALKIIQLFNMAGGLLLPALIYIWLCTAKDEGLSRLSGAVSPFHVLLAIIVIVVAQPVIGWAGELNSFLSLPGWLAPVEEWMKDKEMLGMKVTDAFLSTISAGGLLLNIFMIAVLPALAEELLFRGVLAKLFKDWTGSTHFAVIISALIFAAIHLQFYGFLPRFLLGVMLGYLFFWSGSIWLPVAVHFTNNFISVITEFLFRKGIIQTNAETLGTDSTVILTAISIAGVAAILFYLYRNRDTSHTRG